MRQLLLLAVFAATTLALVGGAQADVRLKAITCPVKASASFKVIGASGEAEGIASEYQWLALKRPGWTREQQALITVGAKSYDLLDIRKGRQHQVICFDITDFFGQEAPPAKRR